MALYGDLEPQLLVEITNAGWGVVPHWSPDGSQLAYAVDHGLYVIPAVGGQPSKFAHLDKGWENWTVRWSPDGKLLAALSRYDYDRPDEGHAVLVVPVFGGELRQLTPDKWGKEGLEWHPDGQRITYHVYLYPEQGGSETHQAYVDGRPTSRLFEPDDTCRFYDYYIGNWTPDGRCFFLTGDYLYWGVFSIYVYDEATGKITLFSTHADSTAPNRPRFSCDGQTITWEARERFTQLWTMEDRSPEPAAAR